MVFDPVTQLWSHRLTIRRNYIFSQKYHAKDGEKYQMIQPPASHAVAPEGMFGMAGGDRFFGGLHEHFGRHVSRWMGGGDDDEERDMRHGQNQSLHIQLTRRSVASSMQCIVF